MMSRHHGDWRAWQAEVIRERSTSTSMPNANAASAFFANSFSAAYRFANRRLIDSDHTDESLLGFVTQIGDGGADVQPLWGLTKPPMRALVGVGFMMESCNHRL